MAEYATIPLIAKPNAGLPELEGKKTVYRMTPEEFAGAGVALVKAGAAIVGGCCGTTEKHIKALSDATRGMELHRPLASHRRILASERKNVEVGLDGNFLVVGERINPTGKPKFKQALKDKDLTYILSMGVAQQESRADVLDVNVGLPGIDEPQMMVDVVKELQGVLELPLQIDTSNPVAMERALRIYNGKPLINSVNGKKEVMEQIFPLVKHYGGVVVALALDEDGIPETADGRIAVAKKIYETAASRRRTFSWTASAWRLAPIRTGRLQPWKLCGESGTSWAERRFSAFPTCHSDFRCAKISMRPFSFSQCRMGFLQGS